MLSILATIPTELSGLLSDADSTYELVKDFVIGVMVFSIIARIVWKISSRTGK